MTRQRSSGLYAAVGTVALGVAVGACGDALVGGDCASGYVERDGTCVPAPATSAPTTTSGGLLHPIHPLGHGGEGGAGGGGGAGAGGGGAAAGGGGVAGGGAGGGGGGGPLCSDGMLWCDGACINPTNDPLHCGGCGNVCPTEICVASECTGGPIGHVAVLGVDGQGAAVGSPTAKLLGNAVFLAAHEPVRILDYRQFAYPTDSPSTKVDDLLAAEAQARGRVIAWTQGTTAAGLPTQIGSGQFDVLLVHDQAQAPAGLLGALGAAWAPSIDTFVSEGGIAVVLATAEGSGEMADLLTASGLLAASAVTDVTGETLENAGWLDSLGQNVLSPFLAKPSSASIATSELPGPKLSFVVRTEAGAPVAIHRVVVP